MRGERLLSKFIFSYPESERKNRKYGTFGRHKEGRYATADRENLPIVLDEEEKVSKPIFDRSLDETIDALI